MAEKIYVNISALYPEASDAALASGKNKYYNDRVKNVSFVSGDDGATINALVAGNYDYNVSVKFDTAGELVNYDCTCSAFSHSRGPCKHIIAAALAFEEKFPDSGKKSERFRPSDIAVSRIISEFSRTRRIRFLGSTGKAKLIPELSLKNGRVRARLFIGLKKKYLVRDLEKFYSDFEAGKVRRYGASLEITSVPESFDDFDRKTLSFFLSILRQRGENCLVEKDTMVLLDEEFDRLSELFSLKLISFSAPLTGNGERLVEKTDSFSLGINIVKERYGYNLASKQDMEIVHGVIYDYIITATNIYPCTSKTAVNLIKFAELCAVKKTLFVSDADMPAFYNGVLKYINDLEITSDEDLAELDAPPLYARLSLDYVYSEIRAELNASYGQTEADIFNDNVPIGTVRDVDAEKALKEALTEYFELPDLVISDEKKIFAFLKEGLQKIYNYADIFMTENLRRLKFRRGVRIRAGVKLNGGLLNLDITDEQFTEEELGLIYKAAKEGREYIKISDVFVDLTDASVINFALLMELGEGKAKSVVPTYYAPYLGKLLEDEDLTDGKERIEEILRALGGKEEVDAPTDRLNKSMRPYQKTGYAWLSSLYRLGCGGILADDMGLGKSLQTIALISAHSDAKHLIICPTTLILNWISEFKKFAPEMKVVAVMGEKAERTAQIAAFTDGALITSYELIRRDYAAYENILFDTAVIDEAQYIKNPETKNALSVKSVKAEHRFALTGTPIENSLAELWSIFDFIMPGYLGEYPEFRDDIEQKIALGNEKAAQKLEAMISPFVLRRLKGDVLRELPPKIETEIICPLQGEQKTLYRQTLALAKLDFDENGCRRFDALSVLSQLRRICCDPSLVDKDYAGNSAKLEVAIDLIKNGVAEGRKILLFSQFTSMIDILRMRLAELGIAGYLLKGDTPKSERITLVNRFNSDNTPIFFISLRAGGTGLNLTGADMVIHYDPWWNVSVMEQATDRAYRIGQDKTVNVYRLLMDDTVERKIRLLQLKKQELGQNFIKESDSLDNGKILELLFGE